MGTPAHPRTDASKDRAAPWCVKSHEKFTQKYSLPFPLLADEETKVANAYGA